LISPYVKESDHTLNFEVSTALFRIAQEGLNNIVKYAEASSVNLHIIDKEDEVYLVLEDNGKGFDERNQNQMEEWVCRIFGNGQSF
jgi:signal transduction histidine kinase